jgi:imidazolonepropionase-like amidohydrolase
MQMNFRLGAGALALATALAVGARADAPHVYAIKGAKIVPVSGATIAAGTVIIRNGLIDAVGAVEAPPDAQVVEGKGLTVYPGLIDMANSTGLDLQINRQQPAGMRTTEQAERWKRDLILKPDVNAADHLQEAPELARLASAGITSVLSTPPGVIVKGRSALVNVAAPADEPAVGNVGDYRTGIQVVRTPVALHIEFPGGVGGDAYPNSLLGVISFIRQSFLDAQHQQAVAQRAAKNAGVRPAYDPSLEALQPALEGKLPVAFEANTAREILRALDLANEFKLDPMISGGREADQVAADLKARNARVIYNLNYPTRSRALPPDADESIDVLRMRANAPKVPAALDKAGVLFAFSAAGLREPRDFVRNAARAVREGLPAEAALRALTLNAAKIAGADSRLGSIEKGRIANLLITDGDLFEEGTQIKHVFVDGRMIVVEAPAPPQRGGRGRGSRY